MIRSSLAFFVAVAVAVAVAAAAPALADEQAIREAGSQFEDALNAGDLDAVVALYTEDAMVLPPDAPMVEGRDAIREMWQEAVDAGMGQVDLEPVDLTSANGTTYEVDTFDATMTKEGAESPVRGKFVVVWKQVDGAWLMHRDIWNMTPVEE